MIPNDNSHVILFLSKMYIIKNWVEKNVKNSNFWRNKKKTWKCGVVLGDLFPQRFFKHFQYVYPYWPKCQASGRTLEGSPLAPGLLLCIFWYKKCPNVPISLLEHFTLLANTKSQIPSVLPENVNISSRVLAQKCREWFFFGKVFEVKSVCSSPAVKNPVGWFEPEGPEDVLLAHLSQKGYWIIEKWSKIKIFF